MNTLKKTLALVATLAMASTAFVGCGKDESSSSGSGSGTTSGSSEATTGADEGTTSADAQDTTDAPSEGNSVEVGDVQLATGGDQFTIMAWNANDWPQVYETWKEVSDKAPAEVNFINHDCGGGDASEKYDKVFEAGDDLDVYFVEADWCLYHLNNPAQAAPLEQLGFSEANWTDAYGYTVNVAKATEGDNEGKIMGASWQAGSGAWGYNTKLAEEYLGVKTPEEMQEKVKDWDTFTATAKEFAEATNGEIAFTATLGGLWQAYVGGRSTKWVENNRIMYDDFCENFAKMAKDLHDCGAITEIGQWSDQWTALGQSNGTLGYFVASWAVGDTGFFGTATSKSKGDWRLITGPQVYSWGGTWLAVNPKTDNADLVQDLILNMTVKPDTMQTYAEEKPDFVNNKTAMKAVADKEAGGTPVNAYAAEALGNQNYWEVFDNSVENFQNGGLITPYDSTIKQSFIDAISAVYYTSGDWQATVDEATAKATSSNAKLKEALGV